jgi:nicotinamidase-related amidase
VAQLPPGTRVLAKAVFGLAGVPEILAAVEAGGRRTAVLVGAETDVCVAQSAIGLLDRGFRVVVVTDATFSPGSMHELGLRRVREAGAELDHAKGVYYEWIRTLEAAQQFTSEHPHLTQPPGFRL